MVRLQHWIALCVSACLMGCATSTNEPPADASPPIRQDAEPLSWIERYYLLGKDTYESACASCHDSGELGAPVIGDRKAWAERSPLWSAVLLSHARDGYLDMPAKGGFPELTDRLVEAAVEYMLGTTFPELPRG